MTKIELTAVQHNILRDACCRPDGVVYPITAGPRGGAMQKVLAALTKRGLVEGDGDALKVTSAAYEAMGMKVPVPEARAPAATRTLREGTKQATLIAMLRHAEGATIEEMVQATGWLSHTVRGAIAGAMKKRLGLVVKSVKEERGRVYRIEA